MATTEVPVLFCATRIKTLLACLLVAICSGTGYVYSAYAPQLGARLNISHTKLNVIGLTASIGVDLSGLFWGRIVDARGPRILLAGAFLCHLAGYSGILLLFNNNNGTGQDSVLPLSFAFLMLCSFMVGAGGNAGWTAAVNSTAKTFPDNMRTTATGFVLSGFGLSAFLFATIAHTILAGDTSSFLLFLAIGSSFPMLVGFFYMKPTPFIPEDNANRDSVAMFQLDNDSQSRLLNQDIDDEDGYNKDYEVVPTSDHATQQVDGYIELNASPGLQSRMRAHSWGDSCGSTPLLDIHGKALLKSPRFWLMFLILSLLSGSGMMFINNVGSMSRALYAKENPNFEEEESLRWQAAQVSSISITNCAGRLLIGIIADLVKSRLRLPRSFCLILPSAIYLLSQAVATGITSVQDLWKASLLVGLGQGALFGLTPTNCIEWFGMPHFSETWGYLSLSPLAGGYLFSIAFGRNLDAHQPHEMVGEALTQDSTSIHLCLQGRECYVDSLLLTCIACALAIMLSAFAGWLDYRDGHGERSDNEPFE